jgi:ubiquinone biosynthesis protein UbiJ
MGRQKTLWIDEDCWAKLEQMEGESISGKVRTAIMSHEIDREAQVQALKRQIAHLEAYISDLEKRPKQRRTMQ